MPAVEMPEDRDARRRDAASEHSPAPPFGELCPAARPNFDEILGNLPPNPDLRRLAERWIARMVDQPMEFYIRQRDGEYAHFVVRLSQHQGVSDIRMSFVESNTGSSLHLVVNRNGVVIPDPLSGLSRLEISPVSIIEGIHDKLIREFRELERPSQDPPE